MKRGIAKFTSFCLAAGLTIGVGTTALLAERSGTFDNVLVGLINDVEASVPEQAAAASEGAQSAGAPAEESTAASESAQSAEAAAPVSSEETNAQTGGTAETAQIAGTAETAETAETAPQENAEAQAPAQTEAPAETEAPLDTSMVGTTGFAQCENYVNVRSGAYVEGDLIGKIGNNCAVEILDVTADGWYKVRSGNVEGYVAAQYIATGDAASGIAAATGYTTAEVGADVLNVRASADGDSEIIATVQGSSEIEVVEDQGDWIKVILDGEMYGYVSSDYVATSTEYATGETLEEEQARLDQEWLDYLAQQEAAQAAAEAAYLASQEQSAYYESADTTGSSAADTYYEDNSGAAADASYQDNSGSAADASYNDGSNASGSADELAAQASSLYQTYLEAQNAADAAVANGSDEQTILDTAAAAQAAYGTYVQAQNAADNAAAGIAQDTAAAAPAPEAQPEAPQPSEDTAYQEAPSAEESGGQTDTSGSEAAPEAQPEAPSSGNSSAGQAIADYACQFVGNPYVYGGSSLTGGADCSGFTMSVMANFGIGLPHNAAAQSGCGTAVSMDSLQPGDLLFYDGGGGIGHVSIYIGNGQVVHASNPTNGILISSMGYRTPVAARRFV